MRLFLALMGLLLGLLAIGPIEGVAAGEPCVGHAAAGATSHGSSSASRAHGDGGPPAGPVAAHGEAAGTCCSAAPFIAAPDLDAPPTGLPVRRTLPAEAMHDPTDPFLIFKPPRRA